MAVTAWIQARVQGSGMRPIDLRSDLLSRPTGSMVAAMQQAAADAPGFGLREDPWVRRLERVAADILGKEDALFCPTCTLCNQIAINIFCAPGDTVVCEATSHIVTSEGGALAAISGAMPCCVPGDRGLLHEQTVTAALQTNAQDGGSRTALVLLENTHTRSGGRTLRVPAMAAIRTATNAAGVPVHLDGARLFNAATYLGTDAATLASHVDSVAISLNKGLAAPIGAVLAGDSAFVEQAVAVRQRLGGGWRPAAIPAAAGIVALTEMVDRLGEDHIRARQLGERVRALDGLELINDPVETNLLLVGFGGVTSPCAAAVRFLEERGVLGLAYGEVLRFALHNAITDQDVEQTAEALGEFVSRAAA